MPSPKQKPSIDWISVTQLTFSLIAALTLWGFALSMAVLGITEILNTFPDVGGDTATPLLLTSAGMAVSGILLLPSAGFAFLKLIDRPQIAEKIHFKFKYPGIIILLFPVIVGLGFFAAQSHVLSWMLLPPLHIAAIGISVLWLVLLGLRGISVGSPQRAWGIFGSGLVLAPLFSLVVEMIALLVVGFLVIIYLSQDPILVESLDQLSQRILLNPNQSPDAIFEILEPIFLQPGTIYIGLFFAAILVPLIEEIFKPIGVWLLIGRKPTPTQGFAAGLISGAGYAVFENFTLAANSGEEWASVITARVGTSLIHILTSGLTGWALTLAWRDKKYIRLGVTYLTSVAIHALWNGLVVLSIAPELFPAESSYPAALRNIGLGSPIGFFVLIVGSFLVYLGCNQSLRRST